MPASSSFVVLCPACMRPHKGSDRLIGRRGRCACGHAFSISLPPGKPQSHIVSESIDIDLIARVCAAAIRTRSEGGTMRQFRINLDADPRCREWPDNDWQDHTLFHQISALLASARDIRDFKSAAIANWQFSSYGGKPCDSCSQLVGRVFSIDNIAVFPPLHVQSDCICWAKAVLDGDNNTPQRKFSRENDMHVGLSVWSLDIDRSAFSIPPSIHRGDADFLRHWVSFATAIGWFLDEEPFTNTD